MTPGSLIGPLGRRVREVISAQALIAPGTRVAVAFSGGPDSLCLLHVLKRLGPELGLSLLAIHVDHGLRPESADEAKQAVALAAGLGVETVVREARLRRGEGNLQERARAARLELLRTEADARGCTRIALGHTASDQAETLLMRLIRGTGTRGLGGMAYARLPFVRPLLQCTRAEVEQHLRDEGLCPLRDASNESDRYLRNRVRRGLVPLLERENPRIVESLCRLAESCQEDEATLDALARTALGEAREADGLRVASLASLPEGLKRRALRLAYAEATGSTRGLARTHVEAALGLLCPASGTAGVDWPGLRLERRYGRLRVEAAHPRGQSADRRPVLAPTLVQGPGLVPLSDGRLLRVEAIPGSGLEATRRSTDGLLGETRDPRAPDLAAATIELPLLVRGPQPGDRIDIGPGRSRKVSRVLMDAKIPSAMRAATPLVFCKQRLVLIVGLRQAFAHGAVPGQEALRFTIL